MSKQLQPQFLAQWLLVQVFGSIALAIATQAIATCVILIYNFDNLMIIFGLRLLAVCLSNTIQGYLQWQILKQTIKTLNRRWIYTAMIGLPMNMLIWGLIHLGIKTLVLDADGTSLIILAIVGAVVGGVNGWIVGNWQKSLLKEHLYWRSLWHDWNREQVLAGALSGVITAVIIIGTVFLAGWNLISSPIAALMCSIGLAAVSPIMYGLIVGDTIQDVFKQAKLID